ncbi:hypothetical protein MF628_004195 [Paenibacillus polymyxa]|uniref:hypothetical protein n=1 Tax=Paenibacillus polymyxa TaxID=1406 RepID=UPI0020242A49|nr:hypothetical protein [Paenibacillus polymyxa]URJ44469.1 hypothetical protein MF628_004195 [Paenibacillus polymyxa]
MNDKDKFILNKLKGNFGENVAKTHFELLGYSVNLIGIENIAVEYCMNVEFSKKDSFSDAVQSYIQNMPDLLVSKNDHKLLKSFFVECKACGTFPNLEEKAYSLYWDYRNMIWTDRVPDDVINLLRDNEEMYYSVLFDGMNPDEVYDDSRTFECVFIEWKRYKFDYGPKLKKAAFECFLKHFTYFDTDIPSWDYVKLDFGIPIKIPLIFYMVILDTSTSATKKNLKRYKDYLQKFNSLIEKEFKKNIISELIEEYENMINGSKEIPNVFCHYNLLPLWIPGNSSILSKYQDVYFKDFENAYNAIEKDFFKYIND